jgi:hypothetical protein
MQEGYFWNAGDVFSCQNKENHAAIKEVMIAIRRRFLFFGLYMYRLYVNSPNTSRPSLSASSPFRLTLYHSRRSNMNDRCGGLGCMMIILFLAASSTVLCMLHPTISCVYLYNCLCVYNTHYVLDESKVTLVFCEKRYRYTEPHDCYCCLPKRLCYNTWSECRAACPRCNPKCPAQSPSPLESTIAYASVLWTKCEWLQ